MRGTGPAGSRHARHLVLVRPLALLDPRVARRHGRPSHLLSDSVLVTGPDIIFFWVARMAMLGIHFLKDVPFRDVYLHAIVRDAEGQKMSKSKGNVADPLVVMEKYGTDAFRFTLAALAQGRDIRISEDRIEGYRNFANKIWNASRLVLSNLDGFDPALAKKTPPALADLWIESRLAATVRKRAPHSKTIDSATRRRRSTSFLWHEFCDWYLEMAKLSLYHPDSPGQRARTQTTLVDVLEKTLRLLHPFSPSSPRRSGSGCRTRANRSCGTVSARDEERPQPRRRATDDRGHGPGDRRAQHPRRDADRAGCRADGNLAARLWRGGALHGERRADRRPGACPARRRSGRDAAAELGDGRDRRLRSSTSI